MTCKALDGRVQLAFGLQQRKAPHNLNKSTDLDLIVQGICKKREIVSWCVSTKGKMESGKRKSGDSNFCK